MTKERTSSEYLQMFNKIKGTLLTDDENAAQMVNHNPMYFITNKGRIFSLAKKEPHEMSQVQRAAGVAKKNSIGSNSRKASVMLCINGKGKLHYVHRLVAEYFPHKTFVPEGYEGDTVIHHICGYNPDKTHESNRADNLLEMPRSTHKILHDMPYEPSEEWDKSFIKQLQQYSPKSKEMPLALRSEDGSTRIIENITYEQLSAMDPHGKVQQCINTLLSLWDLSGRQQEENKRLKQELHEQTKKSEQEENK